MMQLKKSLFNSLPNDKFLDWSKVKALADVKINVTEKQKFVLVRAEKIIGKEKMLVVSIFSFSHYVFKGPLSQGR